MTKECSFCGAPEQSVGRLIAGGGQQGVRHLPSVRICGACVDLCRQILSSQAETSRQQGPEWHALEHAGRSYEWTHESILNDEQQRMLLVRRAGAVRSFGWVVARKEDATADTARWVIEHYGDRLE